MKTSIIVIALLAVSLAAAIAAPTTQSKIQRIGPKVDLPELVLVVEVTLRDISNAVNKADDALYALLEGNPQQEVVRKLVSDAEAEFQKIFEDAMVEALQSTSEELPDVVLRTIEKCEILTFYRVNDITTTIQNESPELRQDANAILNELIYELIEAVTPVYYVIEAKGLKWTRFFDSHPK